MPCSDPTDHIRSDYDQVRAKVDTLTRLLCLACKEADQDMLDPELKQWKAEHDRLDAERIAKERAEKVKVELVRRIVEISAKLVALDGHISTTWAASTPDYGTMQMRDALRAEMTKYEAEYMKIVKRG